MKRKILFTILSIVLVGAIGAVSWILLKPDTNSPMPQTNSESPSPTPSDNKPSGEITEEPNLVNENDEKEAKEAIEKIGTSEGEKVSIQGFSEKDLDEATKFISDYIYATHTNEYFLGGDWVLKDNAKVEHLQSFISNYYSKELVDELKDLEGKQGTPEFTNKAMSFVPFFDESPYVKPSEYCNSMYQDKKITNDITEERNCVTDLKISEIKMNSYPNKDGYYLSASFDVKSKVSLFSKELNGDAQTEVSYKYLLSLEKVILSETESEWQITGYTITPSLSEVKKYEGSNE